MREKPVWEQEILTRLEGRRILILGCESAVKSLLADELREINRQSGLNFEVSQQSEILPEDYVILMGTICDDCTSEPQHGTGVNSWIRKRKTQGMYLRSWTEFRKLTDTLRNIQKVKPVSAVFVSDSSVYGKLFGEPHLIREDEIGYLCHTDENSQDEQSLRMMEHLCSRLAREEGIKISIARLQAPVYRNQEASGISDMAAMLLRVLVFGVPGEPYNIPGPWQVSLEPAQVSPLSPNLVVGELEKAETL